MLTGRIDTKASKTSLMVVSLVAGLLLAGGTAFAAAGDLDRTFSKDGKVTTQFGRSAGASALVSQSDGKLVAAGDSADDFALTRYNRNGTLDKTFGKDGKVTTDFGGRGSAFDLIVQSDGKLVAAGVSYDNDTGFDFALARYNRNGTLDKTFGKDGKVTTDFGSDFDAADAIVVQPDGKLVAAGESAVDSRGASSDFALARYNPNGALDETFGGDGKVTTDISGGYDSAYALVLQPDGRHVVAGYERTASGDTNFALTRYNRSGALDKTFGEEGRVTTDFGDFDFAYALVLQPNGRLVAAGESGGNKRDFALASYKPDGTPDRTFGGDGRVTTDFGSADVASAVALQRDGRLVAAGESGGGKRDFALARYDWTGALDKSFGGGDGRVTTNFERRRDDIATALVVQPNGKLVAAGRSRSIASNDSDFALARFTAE